MPNMWRSSSCIRSSSANVALPAISLTSDIGVFTASARDVPHEAFASTLRTLGRPPDIVLGICAGHVEPAIRNALSAARDGGLLTVLVCGQSAEPGQLVDVELRIGESNPLLVQEVAETLYHVLWEFVHVFLEADDAPVMTFLPPPPGVKRTNLLPQVQASTLKKVRDVCALRRAVDATCGTGILQAGRAMAARVRLEGKLLAFGNGGSATGAQDAAADCLAPLIAGWQQLPALALTNDVGVVTAIGNDVGFEHVFSRQVIALGRPADIALGFSPSGASRNVITALREAKARGLLTMAMSGGDGGELARAASVDFCFTAPSVHLPRIQEAHATIWHALLSVVQEELRVSGGVSQFPRSAAAT